MPTVHIEDVHRHEGETVTLRGWLYNRRSSGKLHFLQVRDGSGVIQAVMFKGDVDEAMFDAARRLPQESSIIVTGTVKRDERSPLGYELGIQTLEVLQEAEEYPISPKEHGVAFLMENRHLWMRSRRQHAILRIRAEIIAATRDFLDGEGYLLVDAPIFTPAACEGTTTLFETQYFSRMAYLTQSGQLYNEAAAMAFGRVYCFGPTFRAEKSKTRRHLTEFWMVEPEAAFLELDGIMDLAERMVRSIVERVLERRQSELRLLERDIAPLERCTEPFPRVDYADAVAQLQSLGSDIQYGDDFGADDETILTQQYDTPILVHRYPRDIKAFYMKGDPERPDRALCVDMLAPEGYGEIIGGGQREDDYQTLHDAIAAHDLPLEAFSWYLDLRRYGSVPHGGFGMGIERAVAWICGLHHVRETIPFPRMLDRIIP
ncbi:MAG: asparagine--tRNA ligase [Deltaproteobacteria bacterium]|nr:MAG: asparagine--tRNA ligase [Deltaproteobacteria bacterium]